MGVRPGHQRGTTICHAVKLIPNPGVVCRNRRVVPASAQAATRAALRMVSSNGSSGSGMRAFLDHPPDLTKGQRRIDT